MPERFIDDNGKLTDDDPAQYIFGLGRRICPGGSSSFIAIKHTMNYSIRPAYCRCFSAIATMLATINISSVKDDQGKAINFTPEFSTGLVGT